MAGKAFFLFSFFLIALVMFAAVCVCRSRVVKNLINISSIEQTAQLFPKSVREIEKRLEAYIQDVQAKIDALKAIPQTQRTFANTAGALDDATSKSDLSIFLAALAATKYLHPDETMRDAAQQASSKASAFFVDVLFDKALYQAFKEYIENNAQHETLSGEQQYYLKETMDDFIRMGLELPDDQLEQVKKLKKELTDLSLAYSKNSDTDQSTIEVTKEGLAGLPDDFIASLKRTDAGAYILGVDYPTLNTVLEQCEIADTRKRISIAFNNRAYPANESVLHEIIAKRDEVARLLGFASYAHLDIDDQMAKTPERASSFIDHLIQRADVKETQEYEMFKQELPPSVVLDADGKFYPWDMAFVVQTYKKKHFDVDEQKIAEYFPVAKTIDGLFSIYQQFFSLRFNEIPAPTLWHDDIRLLEVYDASTDTLLGRIMLDLYPRANKYSHAANLTLIPSIIMPDGKGNLSLSVIMANFPKAQGEKPPLFKRSDVKTFFHEFGHALHAMFGRTHVASFAGTHVKRDFVELPSQMLEEWLDDKAILKSLSGHYKTGEPLPDELIDRILQLKNLSIGSFVQRQGMLAKLSLEYFKAGADKDVDAIYRNLREHIMRHVAYIPEDHMFASFGHLTGYGAKYYGYMWSKVFAMDLFAEIKKMGLLNPEAGKKYVHAVLSRGGSVDPNQLLRDFLGREPNDKAFFEDMGI